jgi:hypothetical protein
MKLGSRLWGLVMIVGMEAWGVVYCPDVDVKLDLRGRVPLEDELGSSVLVECETVGCGIIAGCGCGGGYPGYRCNHSARDVP